MTSRKRGKSYISHGRKYFLCEHGSKFSACRPCRKSYMKKYDQEHRPQSYLKIKEVKRQLKEEVRLLKSKPCTDCGFSHPYWVMQFDHVRGEKQGDVGYWVSHGKRKAAFREIAKCELVCANCHANRSHLRLMKKYA